MDLKDWTIQSGSERISKLKSTAPGTIKAERFFQSNGLEELRADKGKLVGLDQPTTGGGGGGGDLLSTNNLSDLASIPTARSNLGLGTAALVSTSYFALAVHSHTHTDVTDFDESVDDRIASLLVAGSNITLTYNDVANTLTIAAAGGSPSWGSITGTLSSQTDLQSALNGKSDTTHNHTGVYEPANSNIQSHISSTSNPHSVTKAQVGLGNVTNDAQLVISNNLSDLTNTTTARSNLGLGTAAVQNVGYFALASHTHTPPGSDTQVIFNDGGVFGADAGLVYDKTANKLTTDQLLLNTTIAIGTTIDTNKVFNLAKSFTATSGEYYASQITMSQTAGSGNANVTAMQALAQFNGSYDQPADTNNYQTTGLFAYARNINTHIANILRAATFIVDNSTTGGIRTARAFEAYIHTGGSGTISVAEGISIVAWAENGNITNYYGIHLINGVSWPSSISNQYGIYIDDLNGAVTKNRGIAFVGGGVNNSIEWASDTNIYRSAANVLKTDDQFIAADGVTSKVVAGVVSDASFTVTPSSGMIAIDSTNSKLYARVGSTWKSVTLT